VTLRPVDWTTFFPEPVIGVDEVGRGSLAGPVVAAAVILSYSEPGIYFDSKVLSEDRRVELSAKIQRHHQWATGFASVAEVDSLNIFHASLLAMRRAVLGLKVKAGHILVDGKFKVPKLPQFVQTPLVQGDSRAEVISAASIVAKVVRDGFMIRLAQRFPEYGFEIHKGYGTRHHRDMLAALGPCAYHRRSFNGVLDESPSP
jgi:ribonuclease HII